MQKSVTIAAYWLIVPSAVLYKPTAISRSHAHCLTEAELQQQ
jgi:hypothetical protein